MEQSDWVNQARNVCWFSGYAWGVSDGHLLLRQTEDDKRTIRIRVNSGVRPPLDNEAYEVKCHCVVDRGVAHLRYVRLKRASIASLPRKAAWLNTLRGHGREFDPFAKNDQVRKEIRENLRIDDATVDAIIKHANAVPGRPTGFTNKLDLSGFVGLKGFVQPTANETEGHLEFMLHQHSNPEKAIPIRVLGVNARFGQSLVTNMPIKVRARARFEPNNQGEPVLVLLTDRNNISRGTERDFEGRTFPKWWRDSLVALQAKLAREAARDDNVFAPVASEAQEGALADTSAAPASEPAVEPAAAPRASARKRKSTVVVAEMPDGADLDSALGIAPDAPADGEESSTSEADA